MCVDVIVIQLKIRTRFVLLNNTNIIKYTCNFAAKANKQNTELRGRLRKINDISVEASMSSMMDARSLVTSSTTRASVTAAEAAESFVRASSKFFVFIFPSLILNLATLKRVEIVLGGSSVFRLERDVIVTRNSDYHS